MHRAILILSLAAALLGVAAPRPAVAEEPERALVFAPASEHFTLKNDADLELLHEYPDAALLRAGSAKLEELAARGLRVQRLPDPHQVLVRSGVVDLRSLPLTRATAPRGAAHLPLVVAFDGPPTAAQRAALERAGASIAGTLPPSAYLIRAGESELANVERLPEVVAVAPYLPEWKLSSSLPLGPARGRVEIVGFARASSGRILEALAELGLRGEAEELLDRPIVHARLSVDEAARLAEVPDVEWIDRAGVPGLYNNQMRVVMQTDKAHHAANQAFYNPVYWIGVWGASQTVTLADTGLNPHETFFGPGKVVSNAPAPNTCVTGIGDYTPLGHGTGVATTLLGDKVSANGYGTANDYDGLALRANVRMQDIDDAVNGFCPPVNTAANLFIPAWQAGSMIHNNSWGHNAVPGSPSGSYNFRSQLIDGYLKRGQYREHVIVFAAGNAGAGASGSGPYTPASLSDEAHAKNSITVGANWNGHGREIMVPFSSRGPTQDCSGAVCPGDRRIKPDMVAPGNNLTSSESQATTAYGPFPGTSVSAPAVSGAAALVRDYFAQGLYPNGANDPPLGGPPSSALIKAMLVNSTIILSDPTAYQGNVPAGLAANAYPNYDQGYGRPTLDSVLEPAGYRRLKVYEDASTAALTGSVWTRTLTFPKKWNAKCNILRVTLAWSDEPMTLGAGKALVNDLDLEVTTGNQTWRGNHFLNNNQFDTHNNVEDVYVPMGFTSGPITMTMNVYGTSVASAGRQPFAVVVTYGPCPDNLPCEPQTGAGGCYRGPGDVVPGSMPPPPCGSQSYSSGEYDGSGGPYPICKPGDIGVQPVDDKEPQQVEPRWGMSRFR